MKIAKGQIRRMRTLDRGPIEITEIANGIASFRRDVNGQEQTASAAAPTLEAMTTPLVHQNGAPIDEANYRYSIQAGMLHREHRLDPEGDLTGATWQHGAWTRTEGDAKDAKSE